MRCALIIVLVAACSDGRPTHPTSSPVGPIEPETQRDGDAAAGYQALVTGGYVGCGVPFSAYSQVFGPAPEALRAPGRDGKNADLPYNFTRFDTASGVDVVSPNCLQCHAEVLFGELVIGLGNHTADYTDDLADQAVLSGAFVTDPIERVEWQRWVDRVIAVSPYTQMATIGVNPADNLAAALFAHRERDTLAWSFQPLIELPPQDVVPVDVPPWWHMQKKNAMFYTGGGRGDHARIMMTASTLCVDSVDEARSIDDYFPDVRAFLLGLEPPAYPFDIDRALADDGGAVFARSCSRCHGVYGDDDTESYPNLVVAISEVGTDDTLAVGTAQFADRFVSWFNGSFFGELAYLAPAPGYVAPPLDGIWATAPYFHNGSVPTLAAVVDSTQRPTYWTRSFSTAEADYDPVALGWRHTALATGHEGSDPASRKRIYDTTLAGYANRGHVFGDALGTDERLALLEYLKTL